MYWKTSVESTGLALEFLLASCMGSALLELVGGESSGAKLSPGRAAASNTRSSGSSTVGKTGRSAGSKGALIC